MNITFCGHANYVKTKNDEIKLLNLFETLNLDNKINFYIGGYGNFDYFALQCAKKFKKKHYNASIIFVTPYIHKEYCKLDYAKTEYDEIIFPDIENVPPRFAISKRNEWMINQAHYVIAYVKHSWGGAAKTLNYAKKKNKAIFYL